MSRSLVLSSLFIASLFAAGCEGSVDSTTGETADSLKKVKCHSDADCTKVSFCDTENSASCKSAGVCTPRGINLFCALAADVCGCDGQTYAGACLAHKAGVSVAHDGPCEVVCKSNADCGSLQYCSKKEGQCGAQGVCTGRGINLFCIQTYQPVCGCDGNTYSNTCYAAKGGASLAHDGACTCDFSATPIDGDTLAEQPFMNQTQSYFYTFTGNGTVNNNSGTFQWVFSPPCLRTAPFCKIATRFENGTFYTNGSTLELHYDSGTVSTFTAQQDCHNTLQLVGDDHGATQTLVISTVVPTP